MGDNQSWVTEFILVGFQLSVEMQVRLFWIFSLLYLFSLLANGMILGLICVDPRLRTPMYFFLLHLAVIDISYASSSLLNMLKNLGQHTKKLSPSSLAIRQKALYLTFAAAECLILVVMSYDRFVTICHPLHYIIMNWRVCTVLAVTSWACGFSLALINLILLLRLPFCGPQEVNRFFCEILSVLKLACTDTWINEIFVFAGRVFV